MPTSKNRRKKPKLNRANRGPEKIVQADTVEGQRAGEVIVETVENQLKDNDPPETKIALDRLMSLGESRENAMRYIASALTIELHETLQKKSEFSLDRYIRYLNALPELPYDENEI